MSVRTVYPEWTTLGGDPEVALTNKKGVLVPARKVLKKSTSELEIDGFFAELHPKPDTCRERLTSRYKSCLAALFTEAGKLDTNISREAVLEVPDDLLEDALEGEVELGCAPDFDAYTGNKNTIDINPRTLNIRTGGGHIHFGFNLGPTIRKVMVLRKGKWMLFDSYEEMAPDIVKMMDYVCGLPAVLLDTGKGPRERRTLYGKAGAYRIQPHGIEYRVLSNFWLWHSSLVSAVYLLGRLALIIATEYPTLMDRIFNLIPENDIIGIINENCSEAATEVFKLITPVLRRVTDFPLAEFITFVYHYGKEDLYKESYQENWGLGVPHDRFGGHTRTWWGQGTLGFYGFIDSMPMTMKTKYNQIVSKEVN